MKCRVDGCEGNHADDQLVCRKHWFQVPKEVRRRIWDLYRGGEKTADEHRDACLAALASLNRRAAAIAARSSSS